MMLTIGSLFSGIGGLERGLELAGLGPVKWQAESDPFARAVLARHWPAARRWEDVRDVDAGAEQVDVVCGGFPCQDVSLAGTGAGLAGARSGLWTELLRVARLVGCRYLVVENVAALLARGMGEVLGALAEGGFDAAWDCVPAAAVGAPHRRDRILLVAWRVPDALGDPVRELAERGHGAARPADPGDPEPRHVGANARPIDAEAEAAKRVGDVLADPDRWRREVERIANRQSGDEGAPWRVVDGRRLPLWPPGSDDIDGWSRVPAAAQPALRGVADGAARRLDAAERAQRLKALGNAVVPAVAEVVGRLIVAAEEERLRALEELSR
ncbi:MAG: DNA cytosine methyltransferase [Sandaracinaceae bacterium]